MLDLEPMCLELVLIKLAKTRYEREIAAGTIGRNQLSPGVVGTELPGPLGAAQRRVTRETLAAPAERSPAFLAQKRHMAEKLYDVQSAAPAVATHPGVGSITKKFLPGVGPGTMAMGPGMPAAVASPSQAGQFLERASEGTPGILRASLSSLANDQPAIQQTLLGRAGPQSPTLSHAVFRHELGEAAEATKKNVLPFASHMGTTPILEENLAMIGDPQASATMKKVRQIHPDDAMVQRMIRRVGGTADAPIPIGGRQQRALDRMLAGSVTKLDPQTRMKALMMTGAGYGPGYAPKDVPGMRSLIDSGMEFESALKKTKGPLEALRSGDVRGTGRKLLGQAGRAYRFIKSGK